MKHEKSATMRRAYDLYAKTTATTLADVYSKWSTAKDNAFQYCLSLAVMYNAVTPVYILSANTFTFTAGFEGMVNGKQAFIYITPSYDRYIFLDEIAE